MSSLFYRPTWKESVTYFVAACLSIFAIPGVYSLTDRLWGNGQVFAVIAAIALVAISALMAIAQVKQRSPHTGVIMNLWLGINAGVVFSGATFWGVSITTQIILFVVGAVGLLVVGRQRKLAAQA